MSGTFNFCPNYQVAETLPPEPQQIQSMNGWAFSSRPAVPYQRKFKLTLHGLRWLLNSDGTYDETTTVTLNARVLEKFYQARGTWDTFTWRHPHLGVDLVCRFASALAVPASIENSNGLLNPLEVTLIEHNPGFS